MEFARVWVVENVAADDKTIDDDTAATADEVDSAEVDNDAVACLITSKSKSRLPRWRNDESKPILSDWNVLLQFQV